MLRRAVSLDKALKMAPGKNNMAHGTVIVLK
jgi:hypothetical protein